MHIAAACPVYVSHNDVPEDVLEGEKRIYLEQTKLMGKPEKVMERIVEGKLKSFFEQVCLLDQMFVKEPNDKIADMIDSLSSKLGEKIELSKFVRFEITKA